ncbi:MAG: hypothetical protein ACE37F_36425 [Nannocystaceae bacterium]
MVWAALWSGVAGLGVIGVVMAVSEIQAATSDDLYFKRSSQLWCAVAAVVAAMSLAMLPALLQMSGLAETEHVVAGFIGAPAAVAVLACLHNAWSLTSVRRRRAFALRNGQEFEARVVERDHKPFAHDILAVTFEATLPVAAGTSHRGGYRSEAVGGTQTLRLVETCPGDQWGRLAPGRRVRVRLDPSDTSRYALVLFDAA